MKPKIYELIDKQKPPEQRNGLRDTTERIKAARELFERNFDREGKPTTRWGKKLAKKYYVPDYGESYKFSPKLTFQIKLMVRSLIRRIWRWISPPICCYCGEKIDGMIMGVSINYLSVNWYCYSCYRCAILKRGKEE